MHEVESREIAVQSDCETSLTPKWRSRWYRRPGCNAYKFLAPDADEWRMGVDDLYLGSLKPLGRGQGGEMQLAPICKEFILLASVRRVRAPLSGA